MTTFAWALAPLPVVTVVAVVLAVVLTRRLHGKPETSSPGSALLCVLAIAYLLLLIALVIWLASAADALVRAIAVACVMAASLPVLLLLPLLVWHWSGARLNKLAADVQAERNKLLWRLVEKAGRFSGFALVVLIAFMLAFRVVESSVKRMWMNFIAVQDGTLSEALIWSQTAIVLAVIFSVSFVLIMLIRATTQYFSDH